MWGGQARPATREGPNAGRRYSCGGGSGSAQALWPLHAGFPFRLATLYESARLNTIYSSSGKNYVNDWDEIRRMK